MWQTASKLQRQTWGIDHDEFKESRFWRPHCYSLSERTPLERCCIHNMSPFVSSIVAFLQAVARPKFRGPRSASIARSQVWLGLPAGRFKSGGTCRIHAASTRWWSSRGELQAIWPKSRRHLLVTRWESGEQPVVLLTSAFDTWQLYGILRILRSAHVSNESRRESRYFVVAHCYCYCYFRFWQPYCYFRLLVVVTIIWGHFELAVVENV